MLDLAFSPETAAATSAVDDVGTGLGWSFVDAIVGGDFDRLETLFAPDVRFRAIIPNGFREASTATGARALVEDWFSGTDPRQLLSWTVGWVGDRLALGYRLELTGGGERRIVDQHLAAAVDGASFRDVALVCSGFRPLATDPEGAVGTLGADAAGDDNGAESWALTPAVRLDATNSSCATLTPTISAAVRGLDVGAVLEITTDDPEADEGLRSWTRLTGNELVAAATGQGTTRRFLIRRSPQDAATTSRRRID